jgi:hypothetical protein
VSYCSAFGSIDVMILPWRPVRDPRC